MRIARFVLPALALAAAGCILTSGQISVTFDLPDPVDIDNASQVERVDVDLNDIGDYSDHKENLKALADLAILGEIHNNPGSPAIQVEFWMTPAPSSYTTAAEVRANGILLWGPFDLAAGATTRIDWDGSAELIADAGRDALLEEIEGTTADGAFTLYCIGPAGTTNYNFSIHEGVLVLVLDAGI